MFYLDSELTVTRRESSLLRFSDMKPDKEETLQYSRISSAGNSLHSVALSKPKGSVEKEIVTLLFESMLDSIVESWTVIENKAAENTQAQAVINEMTAGQKKDKKKGLTRNPTAKSKLNRLRTISDLSNFTQNAIEPVIPISWWNKPDEKVLVVFRNGNTYEGEISMKCMHGSGKFQWACGTSYMGHFHYNELRGKGRIEWRNLDWYDGDFAGNMRHGEGTYVNSRCGQSYIGSWYCGLKHGKGILQYSAKCNNYDGDWVKNVRHGYGAREYCAMSGYQGDIVNNVREGQGIMIWPNHDFYCGEWKAGLMSGKGLYLWDVLINESMSISTQNSYNGYWENGMRQGHGLMYLGFSNGSHYKGEFHNNKKHGLGMYVTGDGFILQSKQLFISDNLEPINNEEDSTASESRHFDISVGIDVWYHIEEAMKGMETEDKNRSKLLNTYITSDQKIEFVMASSPTKDDDLNLIHIRMAFEAKAMKNAIQCYEIDLKNIYYKYATMCNTKNIAFEPILIRLYLWQLYFDCKIHEKGLTLIEIDKMLDRNPEFLTQKGHNPFENIFYWQYLHSLITVASKLHARKQMPTLKSDTILAYAFRKFMTDDVIPNVGQNKGTLTRICTEYIPLNAVYKLYRSIGALPTIRDFLKEVRYPAHWRHVTQPTLYETPDHQIVRGRNLFVFGEQLSFVTEKELLQKEVTKPKLQEQGLKLFNFGNLTCRALIGIFAKIFPQILESEKIMDLNIELTFLEFYEVFLMCAEASISVKQEEAKWREIFLVEEKDPKIIKLTKKA